MAASTAVPGRAQALPESLETRTARRRAVPLEPPLTRRELRERTRRRGRLQGRLQGRRGDPLPGSPAVRLVVVVLAVAGLGAALLALVALRAPRSTPASTPSAPVTEAVGTATVVGADPLAQGAAGPASLLQGLLDSRAAALTARDPATLARVEQPGSAAQTADAALVRRLVATRQVYAGLVFAAHDVTVVSRSGDRLVLRARVARAPYELVGDGGRRTPQAGSDGTPWRYTLVRLTDGWRLADVQALG